MSEYVKQAKDFLTSCNATMEITYAGLEKPNWDSKPHRTMIALSKLREER